MPNDDWPHDMMELRKEAMRKTIRRVTQEDLRKLGEERFPIVTDPWCERYFKFLKEHPKGRFYRAEIGATAEIVYCREPSNGIWFMPGFGMGFLRPRGLDALAEIVDSL
ncbi:MAG: hypothetical protein ACNA8L_13415 [Luteolibacter sp.]